MRGDAWDPSKRHMWVANRSIPGLCTETDIVIYEPSDHACPVLVGTGHGWDKLPIIARYQSRLDPVEDDEHPMVDRKGGLHVVR